MGSLSFGGGFFAQYSMGGAVFLLPDNIIVSSIESHAPQLTIEATDPGHEIDPSGGVDGAIRRTVHFTG